jgi:hypothetical protein
MMNIFEQNDFRGMALRGSGQDDPYTSRMEINCEAEEGSLNRVKGRQPYLTAQLHCPAVYFEDNNAFMACYDGLGAPVNLPYSTSTFEVAICFKWDEANLKTYGANTTKHIYGHYDTAFKAYTPFEINAINTGTTNNWTLCTEIATAVGVSSVSSLQIVSTQTLSSGAWYWVNVICPTISTSTVKSFMNGSTAALETMVTTHANRTALSAAISYQPIINGANYAGRLINGAVAYVATGPVGSTPAPWVSKVARLQSGDPDISFAVQKSEDAAFIARIGTAASSSYSWNFVPEHCMTTCSVSTGTHLLNASGLSLSYQKQYTLNIENNTMFKQRTVFMALLDSDPGAYTNIIRSEDSTFRIIAIRSGGVSYNFHAIVAPASPTAAIATTMYGRNIFVTGNVSATGALSNHWIAIEFEPHVSATIPNVNMFYYSAATWNSMMPTTTHARSLGLTPPESTRYIIGPSNYGTTKIYDFRVIVGDDSWKTNNTPTINNQEGLVSWLNCNKTNAIVNSINVKEFNTKDGSELADKLIAVSDRVDGKFRYRLDQASVSHKLTGCPYLSNAFCASVDDIQDEGGGDIRGVTDAYYFKTTNKAQTSQPKTLSRSKNKSKVSNVGSNVFITNGSVIDIIGAKTRKTHFPIPIVNLFPEDDSYSEANSHLPNQGSIALSTLQKVKITLYYPETGDESNAFGPFSFLMAAIVGGYKSETQVYTPKDMNGLELRFYRYVPGDGTYHLEGSSKLIAEKNDFVDLTPIWGYAWRVKFTHTLSDEDLVLQPSLDENDFHTPDSTHTTIYNNRGWYVDEYNPSRIYYSKQYYVGTVPTTNLLWTDEGITGDILGTLPGFGGLLLLKERSIWAVSPFTKDEEAACGQIIPNIGCVSGDAAVFVDGVLYWAATEGIFVYDGTTTTNVTKDINGLQKMVWDHDPRGTRAMYDGDNFKVVFWNDGSCITLDVRNGAIRLGSSNDRCVASVSSINYSGPVYGGTGGVFKEAAGNAGVLGNLSNAIATDLMPSLIDDFDTGGVLNLNTATSALVYNANNWYSINGDKALVFDIASANVSNLTIRHVNTGAPIIWSSASQSAPALLRKLYGDFSIATRRDAAGSASVSQSILAFESASPGNFVKVQCFEVSSTSYAIRVEANDAGGFRALDIATVSTGVNPYIAIVMYRQDDSYSVAYNYYSGGTWGSAWLGSTTISASLSKQLYAGVCIEDHAGSRTVINQNAWVRDGDALSVWVNSLAGINGAVYGPVDVAATDYTSAVNWNWTDGNLGTGTKRVGSKFPLWTRTPTWLVHNSLVGREIVHWNDERNDIWSTIIHAVEYSGFGVYYYITKQTDLDEFFIGKRPYYYRGQNIYYGKRADAKKFERIEVVTGEDPGGGTADIRFGSQLHGETSEMTASGSMTFTTSINNSLPLRLRGNYGYMEIEGSSPLDVSDVKMFRVTYKPTRPRGRLA